VIARCQGHSSFVSSIAFDEVQCDGRTYRFGSVGEDNKLLLVSRMDIKMARLIHSIISVGLLQWCPTPTKAKHTPNSAFAFVNYIASFETTGWDISAEPTHGSGLP